MTMSVLLLCHSTQPGLPHAALLALRIFPLDNIRSSQAIHLGHLLATRLSLQTCRKCLRVQCHLTPASHQLLHREAPGATRITPMPKSPPTISQSSAHHMARFPTQHLPHPGATASILVPTLPTPPASSQSQIMRPQAPPSPALQSLRKPGTPPSHCSTARTPRTATVPQCQRVQHRAMKPSSADTTSQTQTRSRTTKMRQPPPTQC